MITGVIMLCKLVTGVMKTGEEKKERKKSLEVVTALITTVMVVYNHGHERDGGA